MKASDKQLAIEWQGWYRSFIAQEMIDSSLTQQQVIRHREKLEGDPIAWCSFFFAKYARYPFTDFHKAAIKRVTGNPEWYEVLSWSRELAKTTIVMMSVCYLVCTGKKRNVLVVSNSQDNACRLLKPYQMFFENNARLKRYYGDLRQHGEWTDGEFSLSTGAAFRALGIGQSPRGTRKDEVRPDVIIPDDVDTDKDCRNPDIVTENWKWIEGALMPTRSISEPLLVIFCGNIIARDCCVARAGAKADNWSIVNIRDKHGVSTWPEKNTEARIDRVLGGISTRAAQAEYFNNPISEGEVIKEVTWGKCPPLNKFQFLIAYGDPSPSNTRSKQSSFKALLLVGYLAAKYYVITGYLEQTKNDLFVDWYYSLRTLVGDKTTIYNYMENNKLQDPFYQQVFLPLFAAKGEQHGHVGIIPDTRSKPDKFARIEGAIEPLMRSGAIVFNQEEEGNPHMKRLEEQCLLLSPQLRAPADGPDALEGAIYVINQKICALTADSIVIGKRYTNSKRW